MRKRFALLLLFFSFFLLSIGQATYKTDSLLPSCMERIGFANALPPKQPVFRIICGASCISENPIIIIDGVFIENDQLKNINPDDIKNITVLKGIEAFGCYGTPKAKFGVIIIETKKNHKRTILVQDILDSRPVCYATVDVISGVNLKDTVRIVADARGKIVTDKLQYGKEYELKITAKGYKSHSVIIDSKEFIKEYKVLIEKEGSISKEFSKVNISKIYPNPVQRSGIVNIDFSNLKEEKIRVMLSSFDGSLINEKLVDAIRGQNSFRFVIDSELPGGIYLLQLSDRYGKNFVVKQLGVY